MLHHLLWDSKQSSQAWYGCEAVLSLQLIHLHHAINILFLLIYSYHVQLLPNRPIELILALGLSN